LGLRREILKPTKEELEELYWKENLDSRQIAKIFGVCKTTVLRWMTEYGISRRTRSEAKSLTLRKLWENPEYRAKLLKHLKEYWSRSEERSKNAKRLWQNPNFRAKMSRARKELWKSSEYKMKMSNIRKQLWQKLEYRMKMIEERKRRWQDPEFRKKMRVVNKVAWQNPQRKEHMKRVLRKLWQKFEYKEKVLKGVIRAIHKRPTNPEVKFIEIVEKYNLPFKYVGDGSLIIGNLNPDFIHIRKSKVIEIFGRVFHDPEYSFFQLDWKRQPFGRISYYAQFGYDCLIIWDDELENQKKVAEKVRRFSQ